MRTLLRIMMSTWLVISLEIARPHAPEVPATSPSSTTQDATSDLEQANDLFRQGSLDEALTAVERSLARSPHSVDALNLLGLIYHREQRYEESVHTFQKADLPADVALATSKPHRESQPRTHPTRGT